MRKIALGLLLWALLPVCVAGAGLLDNGDGTVTDSSSGLMWQKETAAGTYTWQQALAYAEGLTLAGHSDWRLPDRNELQTLVDYSRYNPAVDPLLAASTVSSYYWSSTTYALDTNGAWPVGFGSGHVDASGKSDSYYVRAVRSGQSGALGHLVISSPPQASVWVAGAVMPITWETAGLGGDVAIAISRDGGKTYANIAASTPNDGTYDWTVTWPATVNGMIRVTPSADTTKETVQGLFSIEEVSLDQSFEPGAQSNMSTGRIDKAQTFTVGTTGRLVRVDVDINRSSESASDLIFEIRPTLSGAPVQNDAEALLSLTIPAETVPLSRGFFTVDLSSYNLSVTAGEVLAIVLRTSVDEMTYTWHGVWDVDYYPGGRHYFRHPPGWPRPAWYTDGQDLGFRTYVGAAESGNQNPNTPASPSPSSGLTGALLGTTLSWAGGDPDAGDTVTYDVYFGTAVSPSLVVSGQSATTYEPGTLSFNTTYYWKIVAKDDKSGIAEGPVWSFTTETLALDQSFEPGAQSNMSTGRIDKAQTFTVGTTGRLVRVDVDINRSSESASDLIFEIRPTLSGAPVQNDAEALLSLTIPAETVPLSRGFFTVDLSSYNLSVTAGEVLAIVLRTSVDEMTYTWHGVWDVDYYPGGRHYFRHPPGWPRPAWYTDGQDLGFRTYVGAAASGNQNPNTPASPSPSSGLTGALLGTTLSWTGGDPDAGDTLTYDVYFGTDSGQLSVVISQSQTTYAPADALAPSTIYYWKIVAKDDKGGLTEGPVWSFTTTGHSEAVLSGTPVSPTNATTTDITVGGTAVVAYKYKLDGGAWSVETAIATKIILTGLVEGAHSLSAIAKNSGGAWQPADAPTTHTWIVDTTAPVITGLAGDTTPVKTKTWTWGATDASAVTYRFAVDQSESWTPAGTYGATTTAEKTAGDGTWYLHVQARDAAGNESAVMTVSAVLDNMAPTVSIGRSPDKALHNGDYTITVTASDGTSQYRVNGGAWTDYTTAVALGAEGAYTVEARSTDTAGNVGTATPVVFAIDKTAPPVPVVDSYAASVNTSPQTIGGTKAAGSSVWLNGAEIVAADGLTTWSYALALSEGANALSITVKDPAGNESAVVTGSITLDAMAPTVTIIRAPDKLYSSSAVSITVTTTEGTAQYRLDGGNWTAYTAAIEVSAQGAHSIEARASDNAGNEGTAGPVEFTIDSAAPTVTVFAVSDSTSDSTTLTNDRGVKIAASADGTGSAVTRWLVTETAIAPSVAQMNAGGSEAPATYAIQSAGDGEKQLNLWVMDAAENISPAASAIITLDTVTDVTVAGGNQCTPDTSLILSGTREAGSVVTVESMSSAVFGAIGYSGETSWQVAVTGLPTGSTEITAIATDAAGNWKSDSVTVRQSTPATASFNTGGTNTLLADGSSMLSVTVDVKDAGGNAVCQGTAIGVSTTLGSITPGEYTTENGQFTFNLTSSTTLSQAVITAAHRSTPLNGSAMVTMVAGPPALLTFIGGNVTVRPDLPTLFIEAQLRDAFGHQAPHTDPIGVYIESTSQTGEFCTDMVCSSGSWIPGGQAYVILGANKSTFKIKYRDSAEGQHTISVYDENSDAGLITDSSIIVTVREPDVTPPVTMANPVGGAYSTVQTAILTCSDAAGSGCKYTFYSIDGSIPSIEYTGPIAVDTGMTLRFYSTDNDGNKEDPPKTEAYVIDSQPPVVEITVPGDIPAVPAGGVDSLQCQATEQGGGTIASVMWQVRWVVNGEARYLGADRTSVTNVPTDIPATYNATAGLWTMSPSVGVWVSGREYLVIAKAVDSAGNEDADSHSFIYGMSPSEIFLQSAPGAVRLGDMVTLSGTILDAISQQPVSGLQGLNAFIELTPPDGGPTSVFAVEPPPLLTSAATFARPVTCQDGLRKSGDWQAMASWHGNGAYLRDDSDLYTFTVGKAVAEIGQDITEGQRFKVSTPVRITGRVSMKVPCSGFDLSGLSGRLNLTPAQGASISVPFTTNNAEGDFTVETTFAATGDWQVAAVFDGSDDLDPAETPAPGVTVRVLDNAGYAVIVQGKRADGEGLHSHGFTASGVYKILNRKRELTHEDIIYFNYEKDYPTVVVDDTPTWSRVRTAITETVKEKMNAAPGDLTIVLIDHGDRSATDPNVGEFYIHSADPQEPDVITSTQLGEWIDTLQEGLAGGARDRRIVVVLGFCHAGEFIDDLAGENRIVIASASLDEKSHRGQNDRDDKNREVRDGEVFVSEFFKGVELGKSIRQAFMDATEQIKGFTQTKGSNGRKAPFFDDSAQHPLLNDNGDGEGAYDVSGASGDGVASADSYIGTSPNATNAGESVFIAQVSPDIFIAADEGGKIPTVNTQNQIWAKTREDVTMWVEVKRPDYVPEEGGSAEQLVIDTYRYPATSYNLAAGRWEWVELGKATEAYPDYPNGFFNDRGTYQLFYFAKDETTGETSPMKIGRVYKNYLGNQPPGGFGLRLPEDTAEEATTVVLDWDDAVDPEGHPVTYTVLLSRDDNSFSNPIRIESIPGSAVMANEAHGIQDRYTYYWKVIAVDAYGARSASPVRSFTTNNTNSGGVGFVKGFIYNRWTGEIISGAQVSFSGNPAFPTGANGAYFLPLPEGTNMAISVSRAGFATVSAIVDITFLGTTTRHIGLEPLSTNIPGDADGSGTVSLQDAVYLMQALTRNGLVIDPGADVDGDMKIDLKEMVFILQKVSGLRGD